VTGLNGRPVTIGSNTDSIRKYWPFGELLVTRALPERQFFSGHERDDDGTDYADADLDYMHARDYGPGGGRFLSIDPRRGGPDNQSWNRYAYGRNNPLNRVDPNGMEDVWASKKFATAYEEMKATKFGQDMLSQIPGGFVNILTRSDAEAQGNKMTSTAAGQVWATSTGAVMAIDSSKLKGTPTSNYLSVRSQYAALYKVAHEFGHVLRAVEFPEIADGIAQFNSAMESADANALRKTVYPLIKAMDAITGDPTLSTAIGTFLQGLTDVSMQIHEEEEAYADEVAGRILTEHAGSERAWSLRRP
jgi:RHS repeat-associated protein